MKFNYNFNEENCSSKSGIYKITNIQTNKIYIGSSKRFEKRWHQHKSFLVLGKHRNKHLQNSFNYWLKKLGNDDFLLFEIVKIMENSTMEERKVEEEICINNYISKKIKLYNTNLKPSKDEGKIWSKNPEETRKINSQKKKEFYKTEGGKALIKSLSEQKRNKTYEELYGFERAQEIKKKISDNKLIEMNKPEVKENLRNILTGKTNIEKYGIEKSIEIKQKQSRARKGKYLGKENSRWKIYENIVLISPIGEIFTKIEGIKEFARIHKLSRTHLSELLLKKRKTHHGWRLA